MCLARKSVVMHGDGYWWPEYLSGECDLGLPLGSCRGMALPIGYEQTEKGRLHAIQRSWNPFMFWSSWFRYLASLLILAVVFHDLVLLSKVNRPRILSLLSMKQRFPCLWKAQQLLRISKPMHRLRLTHKGCWLFLVVPHTVWQVVVFLAVIYPGCYVCLILFPMNLCRLGVFLSGCNVILWVIIFLSRVVWYTWIDLEHWAVFFDDLDLLNHHFGQKSPPEFSSQRCICYCEYALRPDITYQLILMSVLMLIHTFGITFRALRGLRRARWGSLFTVTYVVPIEVFPVVWERPLEMGGGPIQFRRENEEVQGEPAFDPFALMDEQPESWRSTVVLQPRLFGKEEAKRQDWYLSAGGEEDAECQDGGIRCCGFPKFACDQDKTSSDSEDESSTSGQSFMT